MAPTAHHVAVDRPDLQHTTSVRMRTQDTPLKLQEMQLMRLVNCIHTVPELRWDVQYQEMSDEVYVEVRLGSVPANAEVNRWWLGVLISVSSAEAELHEVVNGAARGCFVRNVLQAMEEKALVRMGTDSSMAVGITQRLGAGRVRHLEVKNLWIQEKVKSHELKISRVKPEEDNRADLLTKFLDPKRHHKLIKLLPLSVPVALDVVCSLLPVRATAGNQIQTVQKIEEMSVAALMVEVGCWWLCVMSEQTVARRSGNSD